MEFQPLNQTVGCEIEFLVAYRKSDAEKHPWLDHYENRSAQFVIYEALKKAGIRLNDYTLTSLNPKQPDLDYSNWTVTMDGSCGLTDK